MNHRVCGCRVTPVLFSVRYRQEMIVWGERMRAVDNGYFCRLALEMAGARSFPVWIVSDTRRRTDIRSASSAGRGCRVREPRGGKRRRRVTGHRSLDSVASVFQLVPLDC